MLLLLTGLIAPICTNFDTGHMQEQMLIEHTIDWIDSRENLIYVLGADLGVHGKYKNKTDCSGIYAGLGVDLGIRGIDKGKHFNSFKFFELGEEYKNIKNMSRGDTVFFESSKGYHIATITELYDNGEIEILDWIQSIHGRSPGTRKIKIVYYGGYWHYNINKDKRFRLRFATNMFVEEFKRQNKTFIGVERYINDSRARNEDYSNDFYDYMRYHNIMYPFNYQNRKQFVL